MAIGFDKLMERLPPERQERINARAEVLIAEELTLRDLRKAHDLTQEHMAQILKIGQDSVSRIEQRSDLLLSTLRNYVAAMGGTLELVARFPDRPSVTIAGLTTLTLQEESPKRKREKPRAAGRG
jgi:transcriptional regulator with XRE-family HTH domain